MSGETVRGFWKDNRIHVTWGVIVAIFLAGQLYGKFKDTSDKTDQNALRISEINVTLGHYDELLKGQQKINEENARMFNFLIARIKSGR